LPIQKGFLSLLSKERNNSFSTFYSEKYHFLNEVVFLYTILKYLLPKTHISSSENTRKGRLNVTRKPIIGSISIK